jgi:S1-C subfamily serine protease
MQAVEAFMAGSSTLAAFSNDLADAVAAAASSVVQVQGHRRPASGIVYADDIVVTTARALGRGDKVRVRRDDGAGFDADLTGWDPATSVAVLRVGGLAAPPIVVSPDAARVGHIGTAVARSWSNAVTASAGLVSVIGGPLPTGRRRAIDQVIRTSAPMHDGFAGGAFVDSAGRLIGLTTATAIRGLGVVIPAGIVWKTAANVLEHGSPKPGYLGLASQAVPLTDRQRSAALDRQRALLVVAITEGSPAAAAGLLVGDLLIDFDGRPVASPEDLLDLLGGERVGRAVPVRVLRGTGTADLSVTVGERPAR